MKLYNTLSRKKEEFIPIKKDEVNMYVCGPTVYNYIHVGNARPLVVFDTLRRYFKYSGYKVNYVVNFTDIDDKLIKKAEEEDTTVKKIADKYIEEYLKDSRDLNVDEDDTMHPKATENIGEIIKYIKSLVDKGFAYESEGDVYFDVEKSANYGELSKKRIEDLVAGARVDINEIKKNPIDFALWKAAKPGEPSWKSPWGEGRPGWHIECSVMSQRYLGETLDIHAGGADLQFPHHENEIAQSESYTGKKFANYWLHNAMININDEKMSKSKGNFFTVREISEKFDLEVLRFFLISAHYRKPLNFTEENMEQTKNALERIYNGKDRLLNLIEKSTEVDLEKSEEIKQNIDKFIRAFEENMDDDLNTADAISSVFELIRYINTSLDEKTPKDALEYTKKALFDLTDVLGILKREAEEVDSEIEELIEKRNKARENKDYKLADSIRDELLERGIVLEDTADGVKWRRA
ncbi:MAG: cysteine--tRNA ligase [Andreesenia angusta]|nr:cysteine--tRNA ligase [Andreesenia angusta]